MSTACVTSAVLTSNAAIELKMKKVGRPQEEICLDEEQERAKTLGMPEKMLWAHLRPFVGRLLSSFSGHGERTETKLFQEIVEGTDDGSGRGRDWAQPTCLGQRKWSRQRHHRKETLEWDRPYREGKWDRVL
jgi:hypothetical protein